MNTLQTVLPIALIIIGATILIVSKKRGWDGAKSSEL